MNTPYTHTSNIFTYFKFKKGYERMDSRVCGIDIYREKNDPYNSLKVGLLID